MIMNKAVRPGRSYFRKQYSVYALIGTALLLVSCTSSISPIGPSTVGSDLEKTEFFFNGEDFESVKVRSAKPVVRGYLKKASSRRLQTGWSNDSLSRELAAHKRAIAVARSSEIAAKRYAQEAESLRAASQNANGKAVRADSHFRSQQQRAAILQQKATEKSRLARQARLRAARLKQKADAEAHQAQKNMELAKATIAKARGIFLQARAERDRSRRLGLQARQETRLGAGKLKVRDDAYQQASALEKKARARSLSLRNKLGEDQVARKKALQVALAARIKAAKLSKVLASHKKSLARFESHELALKINR